MPPSPEQWLDDYANALRDWGARQTVKLWTQVDRDRVRESWQEVLPAMAEVHRVQVTAALDAVDDYMTIKAAAAGFRYDVTWRDDRPLRPLEVFWGEPSALVLPRAPVVVLSRIKRGLTVDDAMTIGLNYLLRIMSTEPHHVVRGVTLDRVLA